MLAFASFNVSYASTGLTQQEKNDIYFACRGGKEHFTHGDKKSAKICTNMMRTVEVIVENKGC